MALLLVQCVASVIVLGVGVMLLAVGSMAVGGTATVGALIWLLACIRRM